MNIVTDDQDLSERVSRVVEQRDKFRELASEMVATLSMERNASMVSGELRCVCDQVWKPAFDAALKGTELSVEQVRDALAAHGIDAQKAYERIRERIQRLPPPPAEGEWIKMSEKMPPLQQTVQVLADGTWFEGGMNRMDFTHWRPASPPAEAKP